MSFPTALESRALPYVPGLRKQEDDNGGFSALPVAFEPSVSFIGDEQLHFRPSETFKRLLPASATQALCGVAVGALVFLIVVCFCLWKPGTHGKTAGVSRRRLGEDEPPNGSQKRRYSLDSCTEEAGTSSSDSLLGAFLEEQLNGAGADSLFKDLFPSLLPMDDMLAEASVPGFSDSADTSVLEEHSEGLAFDDLLHYTEGVSSTLEELFREAEAEEEEREESLTIASPVHHADQHGQGVIHTPSLPPGPHQLEGDNLLFAAASYAAVGGSSSSSSGSSGSSGGVPPMASVSPDPYVHLEHWGEQYAQLAFFLEEFEQQNQQQQEQHQQEQGFASGDLGPSLTLSSGSSSPAEGENVLLLHASPHMEGDQETLVPETAELLALAAEAGEGASSSTLSGHLSRTTPSSPSSPAVESSSSSGAGNGRRGSKRKLEKRERRQQQQQELQHSVHPMQLGASKGLTQGDAPAAAGGALARTVQGLLSHDLQQQNQEQQPEAASSSPIVLVRVGRKFRILRPRPQQQPQQQQPQQEQPQQQQPQQEQPQQEQPQQQQPQQEQPQQPQQPQPQQELLQASEEAIATSVDPTVISSTSNSGTFMWAPLWVPPAALRNRASQQQEESTKTHFVSPSKYRLLAPRPPSEQVQQKPKLPLPPIVMVQQPQMLLQQPQLVVQQPQLVVQQPQLVVQQPQLVLQQPQLVVQQPQLVVQQPQLVVQQPQLVVQQPQLVVQHPVSEQQQGLVMEGTSGQQQQVLLLNQQQQLVAAPALQLLPSLPLQTSRSASPPAPLYRKFPRISASTRLLPPAYYQYHPFYRLPRQQEPGELVRLEPFLTLPACGVHYVLVPTLVEISRLLTKEHLALSDAQALLHETQKLARAAMGVVGKSVRGREPAVALRGLGRRFLVVDAIIAVKEVVSAAGLGFEGWWDLFIARMGENFQHPDPKGLQEKAMLNVELASLIQELIQSTYTKGLRAAPQDVVVIKRKLLCEHIAAAHFRDDVFEPWRQADYAYNRWFLKNWNESTGAIENIADLPVAFPNSAEERPPEGTQKECSTDAEGERGESQEGEEEEKQREESSGSD